MTIIETLNNILFWILLWLLIWQAYILIVNRGVPNIKTAPAIRTAIIETLREDMAKKSQETYTIIDLGAGNGHFSRDIAKKIPEAHIIGLEISKFSVFKAKFHNKFAKIKNLEYIQADFFKYDLSKTDAVVLYLTLYEMGRIGEKLKSDLKPGALIACNRFALKASWQPETTLEIETSMPFQKTINIYHQT